MTDRYTLDLTREELALVNDALIEFERMCKERRYNRLVAETQALFARVKGLFDEEHEQ